MNNKLTSFLLVVFLLPGVLFTKPGIEVDAQAPTASTGSLVVTVTAGSNGLEEGQSISYTQVSHDFLTGYAGPLPQSGIPELPYGFNLELECIPWVEIEPHSGNFPHSAEEGDPIFQSNAAITRGNDCLLYFGEDAQGDLPEDLSGLDFDALMERARPYLEHAVKFETAHGISLFVIKEPAYPGANLLNLTVSQWTKLVKLTCQTIREFAPQARIVIEIIPQYLPSYSYKPYTFLDDLIRDGVGYDGIMMVFSPPMATRFTKEGYPDIGWVSDQVDVFSDLGKQLLVRFSGVTVVKDETTRQIWLGEMYGELFSKQTVIGIYWDETLRYPAKLIAVTWPPTPTAPSESAEITEPILGFIQDHTTSGVVETDGNGQAILYGYAGEYKLQVAGIQGEMTAHIYRGEERRLDFAMPTGKTPQQNDTVVPFVYVDPEETGKGSPTPAILFLGGAALLMAVLGVAVWKRENRNGRNRKKPRSTR